MATGHEEAGRRLQLQLFGPQPHFQGLVKVFYQPAGVLPGAGQGLGEVGGGLVAAQEPFQAGGRVGARFLPDPHHATGHSPLLVAPPGRCGVRKAVKRLEITYKPHRPAAAAVRAGPG